MGSGRWLLEWKCPRPEGQQDQEGQKLDNPGWGPGGLLGIKEGESEEQRHGCLEAAEDVTAQEGHWADRHE